MNKKHINILASICLLLFFPFAMTAQNATTQQKKSFTLDDLMWAGSNYYNLQPARIYTEWWGDLLVELQMEEVRLLADKKGNLCSEPLETLFKLEDLRSVVKEDTYGKVHHLYNVTFPSAEKTWVSLYTRSHHLIYDWTAKSIVWSQKLVQGADLKDFCFASKAQAYVKNFNLFITDGEGIMHQLSTDGSREILYGQSVHRDEFGIHKGTFWSPKGNKLAFYRMDQSMVTDFPLVDNSPRVATLAPEKYPMAGMTSHVVTVGIYDTKTLKTVYLKTENPVDRYFTNIAWSNDESTLYVIEVPRAQNQAELIAYNAKTGEKKAVLFTEKHPKYVEPMNPIVFLPWDDSKFIYQSRKDGYNHFYLYDTTGKELAQLTKGQYEVIDFIGFNTKNKSIIFKANADSPICHNLYSVNVKNGKLTRLDNGEGTHNAKLSASGAFLVDQWSAPQTYRCVDLVNTTKPQSQRLQTAGTPWAEFNVPEFSCGTIKAADDSTDLYYRMVKPVNFAPTKKYPTVVYVYGGPHAHNVNAGWNYGARPWEVYMAQKGYLLFILDNRGSQYRGLEFENCTHRQLGVVEMQDQIRGVEYLKTLPYVDADRMGVHGWSFGGFMTTNLMCSYPDVFKVGVAGGPVIDWNLYEVMYGERYMDTPQENPEGYEGSNLLKKAGNLKGRLQIIVGYNDPTCILQHSMSFLRAAADAGTQPDYFVYPGQGHNMMGKDMIHLHERITRYFEDFLK